MKIGITGATGHLGRLAVTKLKEKVSAGDITALVRTPSKAAGLGVEAREADYNKTESLDKALAGIDTLLLISASEIGKRTAQHHNVVEAAKRAGVKRIVYTSILHADTSPIDLAVEHRSTEMEIKKSGITYTFLRNGWYYENYTASIKQAIENGIILGCAGDGKFSFATRSDYADAAVAVLTSSGHENKAYELAGDNACTLSELAGEISKQTGKSVVYKNVTEKEYAAMLVSFGLPDFIAKTIAGWDVEASKGELHDDSKQLSTLIGHPTATLYEAVAEALK